MPTVPLLIEVDHPSFAGHFPGQPIIPGVLLLDRAQRAVESNTGLALGGIPAAKFLSPAVPGDNLDLEFEVAGSSVHFDIRCGERKIANGRFVITRDSAA